MGETSREEREPVVCTVCGRAPRDEHDWLWWRSVEDRRGNVSVFCAECDGEQVEAAVR